MDELEALGAFGRDDTATVGGKAANLGELVRAGFAVPSGFVVTTRAYTEFVAQHGLGEVITRLAVGGAAASEEIRELVTARPLSQRLVDEIATAYAELGAGPVAVRSSATAEDGSDASFAGQQDTFLDVTGLEDLTTAVRACWASLWTGRAMTYRAQQGVETTGLAMAVVVQQMVPAAAAGVLFTANPLNGRAGETVISAARGLGDAVVSGLVETEEVVVDRVHRRIVSRRTPGDTPVVPDDVAMALADLGERIEAHFGAPQDIEWAETGPDLHVLQARPITALAPPEDDPPTDWTVPRPKDLYVRASIVEQLPDPLSPLFADLIDGAVTRSLTAFMTELVGPGAVRPGDVGLPTVNGYAYYDYSRRGMLRITLRTPQALLILGTGRRSSRVRWRTHSRPRYADAVAAWAGRDLTGLAATELQAGVVDLLDAGAEYYTAVQGVVPVAVVSEVAFTRFYDALVKRPGDPPAATFLLGFDSLPIRAEQSLFDLACWVGKQPGLAEAFRALPSDVLDRSGVGDDFDGFRARLQAHLEHYGHTVYNLDFVTPVPADDPRPLVDTIRFFLSSGSTNPYERQRRSARARDDATAAVEARLDRVRRQVFRWLLHRAQDAAPDREDALADVGLAWPQLRRLLAELGSRLVDRRVIEAPADVYWLRWAELTRAWGQASPGDAAPPSRAVEVERRRRSWRARRRVTPPQILPEGSGWVRLFRRWLPATSADQGGDVLSGIGASAGRVTAVARVLGGPADFGELQPGEILVAGITTPAWTSLFTRAAGVVTDVGGPLSHSSIVAREYAIPAVLGTAVATKRIRSGQRVTVDGDAGTVTLLDRG